MPSTLVWIEFASDESPINAVLRREVTPFALTLVLDSYMAHLGKLPSGKIKKVRVQLVADRTMDGTLNEDWEGVVQVFKWLDVDEYAALDDAQKWPALVALVHEAMLSCARAHGWDEALLEQACVATKAQGPRLAEDLGRARNSPDRRWRAQLFYEYVHQIDVFIRLTQPKSKEESTVQIANLPPIHAVLKSTIGKLEWVSNEALEVKHGNKKDRWRVTLGQPPAVEFLFARAERDDPHGLFDLGMMYAEGSTVLKDLDKARYWLTRARERGYPKAAKALARLSKGE